MMEKVKALNVSNDELNDYEEECFFKIKKNPDFYGLLLNNGFEDLSIKKFIGSCNAYYNDYLEWQKLKTIDDINESGVQYGYNLKLVDGQLTRERYLLPAYQNYMDFQSKFLFKDYPDSFDKVTLKNVDNITLKAKIKKQVKDKNWIYITGAIRSGRTFCSIALINASANKGSNNLAFIDCQTRIKELQDLFFNDKTDFNKRMEMLKEAHVLVLDGFGNEYINNIVKENIVLPILLARASNKKTTIFTSDFSIDEIISLYSKYGKDGTDIKVKQLSKLLKSMIKEEIVTSKSSLY